MPLYVISYPLYGNGTSDINLIHYASQLPADGAPSTNLRFIRLLRQGIINNHIQHFVQFLVLLRFDGCWRERYQQDFKTISKICEFCGIYCWQIWLIWQNMFRFEHILRPFRFQATSGVRAYPFLQVVAYSSSNDCIANLSSLDKLWSAKTSHFSLQSGLHDPEERRQQQREDDKCHTLDDRRQRTDVRVRNS